MSKNDLKLNVLLAKTDSLAPQFKGMINDYSKFFIKGQGAFQGEKRTYEANADTIDDPTKRGNRLVQTTVKQKLDWFKEGSKEYIDALFSQEATNASGKAKATLMVGDDNWGEFTSLELLRLKSTIENPALHGMMENIPVRSDAEEWEKCDDEMYKEKGIFETPLVSGTNITTTKEDKILKDPNVSKDSPNYTPTVTTITTTQELGKYTQQRFSGEWSQREKAEALRRRAKLVTSIVEALKKCNEVEVVESKLDSNKIFGYLFNK